MEKLLNRGLKFTILPLKLDITQTLVDFRRFERSLIWHEFWFDNESQSEQEIPIFKSQKKQHAKKLHKPPGIKNVFKLN